MKSAFSNNLRIAYQELLESQIHTDQNVNLRQYTWFKTGGIASLIVNPESIKQFSFAISILGRLKIPYKIIGETTNLLFLDDVSYSCLICTKRISSIVIEKNQNLIVAESGAMLPDLSRLALAEGIGGFSGFEGIPGTIGGAVFMNAGAYGMSIQQVLEKVEVVMPDGTIKTLEADSIALSYRDSIFKRGRHPGMVCRAFFRAVSGDQKRLYAHMENIHAVRHRHYEYMYPNLGSIFAGSVYRTLGKKDKVFALAAAMYYLFNYRFRINNRETPINRKWLNELAVKRFNIHFDKQPFSEKSLNVLINNNHHTDDLLSYIDQMKNLIGIDVPIENEIVQSF